MPIPGWTLPGVMTAGAAQILLKSSGHGCRGTRGPGGHRAAAVAGRRAVPAGWRRDRRAAGHDAARQLARRAGASAGVCRLGLSAQRLARCCARCAPACRSSATCGRCGVLGEGRVREIAYRAGDAPERRMAADVVLLHQGVVPNINLANSIGCRQEWRDTQLCFAPVVDGWGASSVDGIAIAGDGAGIGGAQIAAERAAARRNRRGLPAWPHRCGGARSGGRALPARAAPRRARAALPRPAATVRAQEHRVPAGDTIVCRCEEVTARQILETRRARAAPGRTR